MNKVVARSGVSRPTLYAHFGSKDELVAAVLERRHAERVAKLDAWVRAHAGSPRGRHLAVFDWLEKWHTSEGERGCAFVNAAAKLANPANPAREVARATSAGCASTWLISRPRPGCPNRRASVLT